MSLEQFEKEFINLLKDNNEDCLGTIENNEELIKKFYNENENNTEIVIKFVEKINEAILECKEDFIIFEKIFKHPLFYNVYYEFINSTVLIEACKNENIEAINWLVSMSVNVNIKDKDERTAIMYLAQKGNCKELELLLDEGADVNFVNKEYESAISMIINQMKLKTIPESKCKEVLDILSCHHCDFNTKIDKNGNTAMMVLLLLDSSVYILNLVKSNPSINFSIKNKYGESATSLLVKLNNTTLTYNLKDRSLFDYHYVDRKTGNNILMLSAISQPMLLSYLLKLKLFNINAVNVKRENALIIATKAGCIDTVKILIKNKINCNQQDELGNTALHYAVELGDPYLVKIISKRANKDILNNKHVSPKILAHRSENKIISDIVNYPTYYNNKRTDTDLPRVAYKMFKETFEYLKPKISEDYNEFDVESVLSNGNKIYLPVNKDFKSMIGEMAGGFFICV